MTKPLPDLLRQFQNVRVVAGRKRQQRNLFIPCAFQNLLHRRQHFLYRALPYGPRHHARMAKAAAPRAAPHNLNGGTVVHQLHKRNDEIGNGRRQHGHDGFQHFGRCFRHVGGNCFHGAVVVVGHVVKAGHVAPLNLGDIAQLGFAVQMGGGTHRANNLQNRLFPLANHKDINEGGHWFRVVAGVPPGNDQRIAGVPVGRAHRQPGQIEQVEGVGVELLIRQADGQHIKVTDGMFGFQGEEREFLLTHGRFHILPGAVDALGQQIFMLVDDIVHDHQAQVRHAQIVNIGKSEGNFIIDFGPPFNHLVVFATGVTTGLGDARQDAFQYNFYLFWCSNFHR